MTDTLAHGSPQRELSNEYPQDRVWLSFQNRCIIVLWMKVDLALEGLSISKVPSLQDV